MRARIVGKKGRGKGEKHKPAREFSPLSRYKRKWEENGRRKGEEVPTYSLTSTSEPSRTEERKRGVGEGRKGVFYLVKTLAVIRRKRKIGGKVNFSPF